MKKIFTFFLFLAISNVGLIFSQNNFAVTKTTDPDPFVHLYNYIDSLCDPVMYGTLQWAIRKANDAPDSSLISFDIQGAAPHIITLNQLLPVLSKPITIDGTTQTGYNYNNGPLIIIDGINIPYNTFCFNTSGGSQKYVIKGLLIRNFYLSNGINIWGANAKIIDNIFQNVGGCNYGLAPYRAMGVYVAAPKCVIQGNIFGTDILDTANYGTNGENIYLQNQWQPADSCLIGGEGTNEGNVIANSTVSGVTIVNGKYNRISRNRFKNNGIQLLIYAGSNWWGNEGKSAPVIDTILPTGVLLGTSEPGDIIEIFSSIGINNANEYLCTATTDTAGNWSAIITNYNRGYLIAIATDSYNNSSELSNVFEVEMACFADVGNNDTVCLGQSYQLIANESISYNWSSMPTDTSLNGQTSLRNPTVTPVVTTTYTVTVSNAMGCTQTDEVVLNLYNKLTAGGIGSYQTICYNTNPLTFISIAPASGGTGIITYQWQIDEGCNDSWNNITGANFEEYIHTTNLVQATCFRRVASNSCGTIYSNIDTNNLIGYWAFDGNFSDGYNNNNVSGGIGTIWAVDRHNDINHAIYFDGNGYYQLDYGIGNFTPYDDFTFSLWVNFEDINIGGLLQRGHTIGGYGFYRNNTQILFGSRTLYGSTRSISFTPQLFQWYMLTGIHNGTNGLMSLYVNSNFIGNANIQQGMGNYVTGNILTNTTQRIEGPAAQSSPFKGYVDDVRIFSKVLTTDEIQFLYFDTKLKVNINPLPTANAGTDTIIFAGDSVQIGSSPISGYTYAWSPSTGLSDSTVAQPWAKPLQSTTYYLTVMDSIGCAIIDSIYVSIYGSSCETAIELIPDTLFNLQEFNMLDTVKWFKYIADSVNIRVFIENLTDTSNQYISYYIYQGVCDNLGFLYTNKTIMHKKVDIVADYYDLTQGETYFLKVNYSSFLNEKLRISLQNINKSKLTNCDNPNAWNQVGHGFNDFVFDLHLFNNTLYASGMFITDGLGNSIKGISKFESSSWLPLGGGLTPSTPQQSADAMIMCNYNNELIVGGNFAFADGLPVSNIARWNGSNWYGMAGGVYGGSGDITSLCVYDGILYVGGSFYTVDNNINAKNIAQWNGSAWSDIGGVYTSSNQGFVESMFVNSSTGELFVGSRFDYADGLLVNNIAKWDGTNWHTVGSGTNDRVTAICEYNNEIIVGGAFTSPHNKIMKWDGSSWAALPLSPFNNDAVLRLYVFQNELYVITHHSIPSVSYSKIWKWDGVVWKEMCTNLLISVIHDIIDFNGKLYVSGHFNSTQNPITGVNTPTLRIAEWCPPDPNAGPDVAICIGTSISTQLNATGGNSYEWSPTTGLSNPNIANPIASPTITTTYTVTITSTSGCSSTDDVIVNVLQQPTAGFTVTNLCQTNVTFQSTFYDASFTYEWDFENDGSFVSFPSNPQVINNYPAPGNYLVTQKVTNNNMCPAYASQIIQVIPSITNGYNANCCSNNINYTQDGDFTASTSATWIDGNNPFGNASNPVTVRGTIRIPAGIDITIRNMTFEFDPNGKFIIEREGHLTLISSTLQGLSYCHTMWQGIEVWGNSAYKHYLSTGQPDYADQSQQGKLVMNDSQIAHAHTGVLLGRSVICIPNIHASFPFMVCKRLPYNLKYSGGIIEAQDAHFYMNALGVKFLPFKPDNGTGYVNYNASTITNCNFEGGTLFDPGYSTNNPTYQYPNTFNPTFANANVSQYAVTGIYQWGVRYVTLTGNTFGVYNSTGLIEGIKSYDSPYNISTSLFQNLDYGIRIFNSNSTIGANKIFDNFYIPNVSNNGFFNINDHPIQIEGTRFTQIVNNTIGDENADYPWSTAGILLKNCMNFRVHDNDFYKINKGIEVVNSSKSFSRNLTSGFGGGLIASLNRAEGNNFVECPLDIETKGFNHRLQIKCNTSGNIDAAYYNGSNWENFGFFSHQGQLDNSYSARKPAGNAFFPEYNESRKIINNNFALLQISYPNLGVNILPVHYTYYRHGGSNYPERIPSPLSQQYNINAYSSEYNPKASCLPYSIPLAEFPSLLKEIEEIYWSLLAEYESIFSNIDGGSTQLLLDSINSTMPANSLLLLLLEHSPLSDTVIAAAINRPMPSDLIADFIVPNSPLSDLGRYYIDNIIDTLHPRVQSIILDAQAHSSFTTLTSYDREMMILENDYQFYLNSFIENLLLIDSLDKVFNILDTLDNNDAKRLVLSTYLADSNYTVVASRLEDFEPINAEEEDWKALFTLLYELAIDSLSVFDMDSTQEALVRALSEDNSCSPASVNAQAILRLLYQEEFPNCPANFQERSAMNTLPSSVQINEGGYLGQNIPNPFTHTTLIPYRLPENAAHATIRVFNITGKKIHETVLQNDKGTISLSLDNFKAGIYLYSLIIDNKRVQTKRMVFIK